MADSTTKYGIKTEHWTAILSIVFDRTNKQNHYPVVILMTEKKIFKEVSMNWTRILLCIIICLGCSFCLNAMTITVGTGTSSGYSPMIRTSVYSTYESIITQTELAYAGNIRQISFEKASGSNVNPIQNVTIYLKHTAATDLATGVYSTTGYTQVYTGNFTNDVTSGWVGVLLSTPFYYNNVDNLQILIVKGMQTALSSSVAPK